MAAETATHHSRTPSVGAPITDIAAFGPGFSRPKHKRTVTGFGPHEIKHVETIIPETQRAAWKKHSARAFADKDEFQNAAVRHIETTLARSLYNSAGDDSAAYGGAALALRDRLIM